MQRHGQRGLHRVVSGLVRGRVHRQSADVHLSGQLHGRLQRRLRRKLQREQQRRHVDGRLQREVQGLVQRNLRGQMHGHARKRGLRCPVPGKLLGAMHREGERELPISCQTNGYAECTASAKGGCTGNCSASRGVIVCNGIAQDFVNGVAEATAWIKSHVVVTGSASSSGSCTSNSCQGQAEAQGSASTNCAVSRPGGTREAGAAFAGVVGALAVMAARKRRRS